jgi:hypothetical protein
MHTRSHTHLHTFNKLTNNSEIKTGQVQFIVIGSIDNNIILNAINNITLNSTKYDSVLINTCYTNRPNYILPICRDSL